MVMCRLRSDFPGHTLRRLVAMVILLMCGLAAQVRAQAEPPQTQPASAPAADAVPDGFTPTNDGRLLIKLKDIPIKQIFEQFSRVSGMTLEQEVPLPDRTASISALSPISVADAIETINAMLSESGQAVIQEGNKLRVIVQGNPNTPLNIPHEKLMVLSAIVLENGRWTAYVTDKLVNKILRLQSGDGVLDGIVVDIREDQMLINRQGRRSTILVGHNFES
jgi:hypothetical protein